MIIDSPYPGLRPFDRDEAHLFFGREEQTDELLRRLQQARFLAVVGPSGCGKSSLVRAGMIAALETGFMVEAGSRWEFAVMRPGGRPIQRLATALIENTSLSPLDRADTADALGFLTASLRRGPLGLIEALQITPLAPATNLLILVDQFEEIFRFRREGGADEADAFVALLLETARQREVPVYVVITMRSDFFGHCAVFAGLPEVINESQFLTPRLSREQREAAIVGPARVHGGDVEPTLVNRLLNEMGSDPDQLPILQHLLMRMWTYREASATSAAAQRGAEATRRVLTLHDYEQVGGLRHALSNHADEAYGFLAGKQKKIAELLFRRLSERGEDQLDIRRPTPAGVIASLCDVAIDEVVAVVDVFRAPGVSFLMPAWPEPIDATNVVDISHESLIRQWDRLQVWAREEAESAERYHFLEQTARRWRDGEAALWGTPNLELALDWRARERPTAAWAQGYGGDFALAMAFLDASEAARRKKETEASASQRRQVWRLRVAAVSMAITLASLAGSAVFYLYGWVWPHESYYSTMIKRWGKPEGYGQLRADQVGRRAVSLKFIRNNGWFGEVDRVEAVDREGNCTHYHRIGTYLEYAPDAPSPMRECAWEFIQGHDGNVVYEKAYNKFEELVWGFAYVPPIKGAPVRSAYFVGPDGFPQPRKNSKAEIVRFEYDKATGNEVRLRYWDRSRQPQPALDRAYGQEIDYNDYGLPRQVMSLDPNGEPMNDTYGNAYFIVSKYDELGNIEEAVALDKSKKPVLVTLGFHKYVAEYSDDGNVLEQAFYDHEGMPTLHRDGYHRVKHEYDDRGNMIAEAYFDISGHPMLLGDGYHRWTAEYDNRGNRVVEAYFDSEGRPTVHSDGYHRWMGEYDDRGNVTAGAYFDVDGQPAQHSDGYHRWTSKYDDRGNVTTSAYFDGGGRPTALSDGYHRASNEYDDRGNVIASAYFDVDGRPAMHTDGYHRATNDYDHRGNLIAGAYFDVDDRPAVYADGYHRWTNEYDDRGNSVAGAYFDVDGRPVAHPNGYHRWTGEYDDRGNRIAEAYFGVDSRPTVLHSGYHRWTGEYDERGNRVAEAYFDVDGQPALHSDTRYHRWTGEYDGRGNRVAEAYFDVDGQPALHLDGYHRLEAQYDGRGNMVQAAFYGPGGELMLPKYGHAMVRRQYDEDGHLLEEAFYGSDEKLLLHPEHGYAVVRVSYDGSGNLVEAAFYGADDKLMLHPTYGYAIRRNKYDEGGQVIQQVHYGADGGLLPYPK